MNDIHFITVTPDNVTEVGMFCIKDKKAEGFRRKAEWFRNKHNQDVRIVIAADEKNKHHGFIEYISSEAAWRPIKADNYLFIQCIMVYGKKVRNNSIGSRLIEQCENDARIWNKSGVCAMVSKGTWIAGKDIFEKNGYEITDKRGRFELMYKPFDDNASEPELIDWTAQLDKYQGWHLIYSDQCPWHEKAIAAISEAAEENGIDMNITKLETPHQAQKAPSGFGAFALVKDGKLLEDHYISKTRFSNILKKNK
jgi:hypothetical protein